MTKEEAIAEMELKGAVNVKAMEVKENRDYNDNEIHPIWFRRDLGNDQYSEEEALYLIKIGTDSFKFKGKKPDWMNVDNTPPRDFHKTEGWLITRFNQAFSGWEARAVTQRREGDADVITVEAITPDPENKIVYREFKLRMDGTTPQFNEIA